MTQIKEEEALYRIKSILKSSYPTRWSKLLTSKLADTASILSDLANRFDDIKIRVSVLNVCETQATKIKSSRLLGV